MRSARFFNLLIVFVMLAGMLAACAAPTAAPAPAQEAAPAEEAAPAQEATPTEAAAEPAAAAPAADAGERRIRTLYLVTQDQGSDPKEYEIARFTAESLKALGLDVELNAMPWEQVSDLVWYQRDKWDFTVWQMVGRPERSDPDELVYNLYHSSTAETGYNFVGYLNPEYDKLVEAQRSEIDPAKRVELVKQAQQMLAMERPYDFYVHQYMDYVFNKEVWDPATIVEQAGIGAKNFWTMIGATPIGEQKDMVLVSGPIVTAINPLYISGGTDSWVYELVWDRLMRIGPDGLAQPWAAEKVEWVDGQTVDVTLRQGMKWHDGQPVTVDDVVFSFQAPMGEEAPMYKPFVSRIAGIEATDENTVRFTLSEPYVPFETASLAKINLIPKHIWEPVIKDLETKPENAEKFQEEVPIGSGPFKFVAWKSSEEIVLEANPEHFSPPKMNRWVLRFVANPEAVLGMMHSGELNFISFFGGDPELLAQEVANDPKLQMVSTIELGSRFLAYNLRRAPFDDVYLRQALALVIDKEELINGILKGRGVLSKSIISPSLAAWYDDTVEAWSPDIEKAKALLAEHGYEWDADGRLLYPAGKTETLGSE